jgi:hypothetical protein
MILKKTCFYNKFFIFVLNKAFLIHPQPMNNTQKIILLSAISLSGISKAQQSQFFADKEQYRFNLAENLYQNKIYAASQYEFSRQYFYNQNLENSKKRNCAIFQ